MTGRWGIAVLVFLVAVTAAEAQRPRTWSELSPSERERAWRNYQRFESMPRGRRQQLEDRYRQFRELPRPEQDRLRRNYDAYRELPPDAQHRFRENYRRWKQRRP